MGLTITEAFGRAARELREERDLTQEEAALNAGIDQAFYSHIENGKKSPTLKTVARVALALEVTLPELFDRTQRIIDQHGGTILPA